MGFAYFSLNYEKQEIGLGLGGESVSQKECVASVCNVNFKGRVSRDFQPMVVFVKRNSLGPRVSGSQIRSVIRTKSSWNSSTKIGNIQHVYGFTQGFRLVCVARFKKNVCENIVALIL